MGFVVGVVKSIDSVPGKEKLKVVDVDIGEEELVKIVTNAPNIREGTRTCIATVGTTVEINGSSEIVRKTSVGGIWSNGMVCDSVMLGWVGGAAGLCVQVPESFAVGSQAPASKPRLDGAVNTAEAVPELSAKELKAKEKAERKLALATKKAARLSAKAAATTEGTACGEKEGEEEDAEGGDED
jgi:tRNA-binding EMAP/Myf-like protein